MANFGTAYIDVAGNFAPLEAQIAGFANGSAGRKMSALGKSLTKSLTLPLVGVGAVAAKMSMDFDRSMELIHTQAGASSKEVDKLKKSVLDLAKVEPQGPQALSEALFRLEGAGLRGQKAMKALKTSADLAAVGNANVEDTAKTLSQVWFTNIKGAENFKKVAAEVNATVGAGDLRLPQLVDALGTGVLAAAKEAGLSLQDVNGAMAVFGDETNNVSGWAAQLATAFHFFTNPTEKAKGALLDLGLSGSSLAQDMHKPKGLITALADLKEHLDKLPGGEGGVQAEQALGDILPGGRGRVLLVLLNQLERYEQKMVQIKGTTDAFGKSVHETMEQPAVKLELAWSKMRVALIQLGAAITPVIVPALEDIAGFVSEIGEDFDSLSPSSQKLVVDIGLVVAALGPGLVIAGKLVGTFATLASVIKKAAVAVGLLTTAEEGAAAVGAGSSLATGAGGIAGGAAGARWLGTEAAPATAAEVGAFGEKAALAGSGLLTGVTASGAIGAKLAKFGTVAGGIAGGYFAAEFGAKAVEKITGANILEGQDLKTSLSHGFNTKGVVKTEIDALQESKGLNFKLTEGQLDRLRAAYHRTMQSLSTDSIGGLATINEDLAKGLNLASREWAAGTKPWRHHTAEAMEGAVHEIREGIADGTIKARQGQRDISKLLQQIHLVKGSDPFGLAEATASSFKQANQITSAGVKDWTAKLALMPGAARKSSIDSTMEMLKAWGDGHPKIEHQIDSLTAYEIHKFGATNKQLREGVQKGATGPVAEAFREAAEGVGGALQNIGTNTNAMLKALGLNNMVEFKAQVSWGNLSGENRKAQPGEKVPTAKGGAGPHRQRGGIVPGHGDGDSFHTAVPTGSFVMNREATRAFGFQGGGHVPVVLEPRERVFTPPEVKAHGLRNLEALNAMVPRFAKGGQVDVSGPGVLASLGGTAMEKVAVAAARFIDRHKPKVEAGGVGGLNVPTGPIQQMAREMVSRVWGSKQWAPFAAVEMREAGWDPHAQNPTSTAYGLAQNLNPSTYPAAGRPGSTAPLLEQAKAQLQWMVSYIKGRYGDPAGALAHEESAGWYAKGGLVPRLAEGGFVGIAPDQDAPAEERKRFEELYRQGILKLATGGKADSKKKKKAPSVLERMLTRMKELTGIPYPHPDSHFGLQEHPAYLDCSAAVSNVLWKGGLLDTEETSGTLEKFGKPGVGKFSIFANSGHAFIEALGRFWGTSVDDGGSGGLGYHSAPSPAYLSEFVARHVPDGLLGDAPEGVTGTTSKPDVPKVLKGKYIKYGVEGHGKHPDELSAVQARYKVVTNRLNSFGSLPDNLEACTKELRIRQRELGEYRAAVSHVKDPETVRALTANINLLKARVGALREQRLRLLRQKATKAAVKKITEAANFLPWTSPNGIFAKNEDLYNRLQELADQSVTLEPEEPLKGATADWVEHVLKPYVDGVESPAYGRVLGAEASWRNSILGAEEFAGQRMVDWREQITKLHDSIEEIKGLRKTHPRAYKKRKGLIPGMEEKMKALRADIVKTQTETLPEWEDTLGGVQGLGRSHTILESLSPVPTGDFGGDIFDTQLSIKGLGLKVPQALANLSPAEDPGKAEHEAFLEEQLIQANQRNLLRGIEERVFAGMPKPGGLQLGGLAYGGKFHQGGVVPGPPTQEVMSLTRGGEAIFTEEQTDALGGMIRPSGGDTSSGDIKVHVHGDIVSSHPDPVEVLIGDRRFPAEVRKITGRDERRGARGASRGLAPAGVFSR